VFRRDFQQFLGLMLLGVLLAAAPAFAASAGSAAPVAWRGWNEGLAAAAGGSKPVIVVVYTDWCGWCKRMDHDVYSKAEVSDYLNHHFVMVRLNAESAERVSYAGKSMTARALAGGFQVTGYPTMIFLKPDGTHMVNVPGYVPADRFMKLVRFIGDGHMDRGESWEEYSRATGVPGVAGSGAGPAAK
jgi:thioredoxin-related protein